jgi:hypothetical protein
MVSTRPRGHRLNENHAGELGTEGEAGVANLADQIGARGHEPHELFLAESDLPQPLTLHGISVETFDPNGHACPNAVERAKGFAAGGGGRIHLARSVAMRATADHPLLGVIRPSVGVASAHAGDGRVSFRLSDVGTGIGLGEKGGLKCKFRDEMPLS